MPPPVAVRVTGDPSQTGPLLAALAVALLTTTVVCAVEVQPLLVTVTVYVPAVVVVAVAFVPSPLLHE